MDGEAARPRPRRLNRNTAAVRAYACPWVELEVRLGTQSPDANVKGDGRKASSVGRAEMSGVLAALDETERTLKEA